MKKRTAALLLSMALTFSAGTAFAAELPTADTENQTLEMVENKPAETPERLMENFGAQNGVYSFTINYDANGGTGSMGAQTVSSNAPAALANNDFTRDEFTFTGWNTAADGTGTEYTQGQDVSSLAQANDGQTLTLYAQWKINAPKLNSLTPTKPGALKIKYSKIAAANSYELEYSTSSNFKKATKVTLKKGTTSTEIIDFVPGKKYFVRIRSNDGKNYGDWSNVLNKKTKKGKTLENTKCSTGIEADIKLTGSGSGYHAKLVLVTPTSAVSYGIQFDKHAVAPYTNKSMALIENVASNAAGGQQYTRPGNKSLKKGKTYHMMITIDSKGNGNVYLDYKKIGHFKNSNMAKTAVYPRLEAAVRLNNDKVNATFSNVKMTRAGKVSKGIMGNGRVIKSNKGIKTKRIKGQNKVTISGKGKGIHGDWDSDYENVSGIYDLPDLPR